MKKPLHYRLALPVLLALVLLSACDAPRTTYTPASPTYYYVTPSHTFLRDGPGYDYGIVTDVFSGERAELLDRTDYGWSRVRLTDRSGVGWIYSDLLAYSPSSPIFYVSLTNVYLRDCADYNCRSLELLHRGDQVERLEQDYRGWWRVMSLKSRRQGWVPVAAVSPRPGPPYFYVNVSSLALRAGPSTGNRTLVTLNFNDQVEMLGMSPAGWANVRDLRTNIIGWAAARYLESYPVSYPKAVSKKKKAPAKQDAPEPEPAPKKAPKAM